MEERKKDAEFVNAYLEEWNKIPMIDVNSWNYTHWVDEHYEDNQDTGVYENAYGTFRSRTAMEEVEMDALGYG
jgi:hypothetical protein